MLKKNKLTYLGLCEGISTATVAWKDFMRPVGFAEIEEFPSTVLKYHYPGVPNFGDITKFKEWDIEHPNVIIGGTPCQSFSVAGLRKGLEVSRGNLTLTFVKILEHFNPEWFIWENVPGVFSSNNGRDFHSFTEGLQTIGYSIGWRVLDAQYFGLAQRRKRVFVVGNNSGNLRSVAEVLFERESLFRNFEKSRQKGKEVTRKTGTSTTTDDRWPARISNTLDARYGDKMGLEDQHINSNCPRFVPVSMKEDATDLIAIQGNLIGREKRGPQGVGASDEGKMYTLTKADVHAVVYEAHAQDARYREQDVAPTIQARHSNMTNTPLVYESDPNDSRITNMGDTCTTVTARWGTGGNNTPLVKVGDITEEVKVRKHEVDIDNLQKLLRTCKSCSKKTNKQIAEELSIPMTKVEHWFRTDSSFAIPSDDVWFDLKKCISIDVDTFDAQIMEFEYKEGVFESTQRVYDSSGKSPTITATNDKQLIHHKEPKIFQQNQRNEVRYMGEDGGISGALSSDSGAKQTNYVHQKAVIRRLTPVECERLQGFPDNYTQIPWRGKDKKDCPDSHRYKALGNAMAVPVIRFLGKNIAKFCI